MQIWRFTDSGHPVGHSVAGHFDQPPVVTSALVAAHTDTGRGTTFVVRLPLSHQPDSIR